MLLQFALHTPRLLLRSFHANDSADVQRLAGAPEVAATTANIPHPYPDGAAEAWIATQPEELEKETGMVYAICSALSGELYGAIGLMINKEHRRAEMGYWIGVPYWGKGFCTEAARAVVAYAFQHLELDRIFAYYFSSNPASGRVLQKIGMIREGCYRRHIIKSGEAVDVEIYGLLRSEWRQE